MEMVSAGIRRLHTVAYISVLAVATPLGIVIGIAATSNVGTGGDGASQDLVIAVLSGKLIQGPLADMDSALNDFSFLGGPQVG